MSTRVEVVEHCENGEKKLYQWDLGRKIKITTDKTVDEVHFSNVFSKQALVVKPQINEELEILVPIPNILLQTFMVIDAYVVCRENDGRYTSSHHKLDVIKRNKPSDYVYTETEIYDYIKLEERVAELEKGGVGGGISEENVREIVSESTNGLATERYVDTKVKEHDASSEAHTDLRKKIESASKTAESAKSGFDSLGDWAKEPKKPTYTAAEVGAVTESDLFAFSVKTETEVAESLNITDSADYKMLGLKIFGKAVQENTATPDYPQSIKTTENPVVSVHGKNYYNGGDVSGELSVIVPVDRIEPGTYFISADSTSTDTDEPDNILVLFRQVNDNKETTDVRFTILKRGSGSSKVILNNWINRITFYASTNYQKSIGDSFTFSNIQLELGDAATNYTTYKGQSVDINHTLCAVPVSSNGTYTDADGQQWICDTVDFGAKIYTQRIKKLILTGAEAWKANTAYDYHYDLTVGDNLCGTYINPILSSHYPNSRNSGMYYATNVDYAVMTVDGSRIRIKDARYQSDLEGFKAMLAKKYADGNPVVIYYALANPVETALTDAELEKFEKLQTYYNVTRVDNDQECPMQVQYVADTKLYIDRQINATLISATARVASLEQYVVQT